MGSLLATRIPLNPFYFKANHRKLVSCCMDSRSPKIARQLIQKWKQTGYSTRKSKFVDYSLLVESLSQSRMPDVAHELFLEMKSEDLLPNYATLSALLLCFAESGHFTQANAVWEEILNSSFVPDVLLISRLMDAYGKLGHFDEVTKITREVPRRPSKLFPVVYSLAMSCFGKFGQFQLMESTIKEMTSKGIPIDSSMGNAIVRCYSAFGSLEEIESAYGRLKKSRLLIEGEEIRAVSYAYLKRRKFYRLREFLSDVGLGRKNLGNLLWNLVLLSYASDFKMKSLQREFLRMLDMGFSPDLTTFNIRALAFSRMALFWDLHLTLEHMRHRNIVPDLVTFGCVVDLYVDRRLSRNLEFAYKKMNADDSPVVLTDPLVFEVLGKGDFHYSSEAVLEFNRHRNWSYRKLIGIYLKKQFRRDQIFWNY